MDKQFILDEIRRLTATNGGDPPGSRTFASETGIKECDWKGKIWARWGDALREAGFSPNQLNRAFGRDEVLANYAQLSQELGHLPTDSELLLKKRSDPAFPHANVYRRFGSKPVLVRAVLEYCQRHETYADVIRFCQEFAPKRSSGRSESEVRPDADGFVYLLRSEKFYKVGKTNSIGRREYELSIQLPERATTVHVIRTDDPAGIEAYWHNRFAAKRKNGEWFALDAADIAAFKRRKFM